jgi:hypothetical protein
MSVDQGPLTQPQQGWMSMSSHDLHQPRNTALEEAGSCEMINQDFFSSFCEKVIAGKVLGGNDEFAVPASITAHQYGLWDDRSKELRQFKQDYGLCCVPSRQPQNAPLCQWIICQRYQYKLKNTGRHSTMTAEPLGIVWDSHPSLLGRAYELVLCLV